MMFADRHWVKVPGGQRIVTRFALLPKADVWYASMTCHWYLDWDGPRPNAPAGPPLSMSAEESLRSEGGSAETGSAAPS